jgi:predicted nucleic acid-binding protein
VIEDADGLRAIIDLYASHGFDFDFDFDFDFADLMIYQIAQLHQAVPIVTFDTRTARLAGVERLSAET